MMKPNIHPEYRTVVFHDTSVDEYFKIGSTIKTDREIELDGVTYPYVTIDVSSKSPPDDSPNVLVVLLARKRGRDESS